MNPNFLDFEQPIADLESRIQELRRASDGHAVNIDSEVDTLQEKLRARTAEIFSALTSWQISPMAASPATAPTPTTRPLLVAWRGSPAAPAW